ncbi:O-antigen ligase family protein [Cohnella fermenti]|uniref:O-antigen ligase family protein n=1 Tax=Cohnella fermenti TaxID=2565925 RepID=A0A4S4BZW7_9BACL|nr:O-antigen ligase family protein [Cohnella fermenti]THF80857.1 O-antigen ligase family protein [Cohnella fermenti]
MAGKQRKQKSKAADHGISGWEWLVLALFTFYLALWPFQFAFFNGAGLHSDSQMFFEEKTYYGIILGIPALLLVLIKVAGNTKWEKRHLIGCIALVWPLLYFIHSFHAESTYLNRIAFHNSILLYSFFVLGIVVSGLKQVLRKLIHLYYGVGSIVVLYSFAYLLGNRYRLDALSFNEGVRLTSIFTYANAYAAFLVTMLLIALYQLISPNKHWIRLAYAFMLVPIGVSLLLTLSRGAILMLPVIAVIVLLLVNIKKQLQILIYAALAFIPSFAIQSFLADKGLEVYNRIQTQLSENQPIKNISFFASESITGWLLIIGTALALTAVIYWLSQYMDKTEVGEKSHRHARFYIPILLVCMAIIGFVILRAGLLNSILPDQISDRFNNFSFNTHSVLERYTFYKDAITIWQENKWLGGGGGTWEALYDHVQSYPYMSSQPHSYIVELFLDTGIIGLVIIVGGVLYLIGNFIVRLSRGAIQGGADYLLFLLIPVSLLLHSVIDFEMSYMFFSIIVFFSIGVLAGQQREAIFHERRGGNLQRAKYGMVAVWGVMTIYLFIGGINSFAAHSNYNKSIGMMYAQQPFNQLNDKLEEGLTRVHGHPFLLRQLSQNYIAAFQQTGEQQYAVTARKYVDELLAAEPNSSMGIKARYQIAIAEGDLEEAVVAMDLAISTYPYEIGYYEQAITNRAKLWDAANSAEDSKAKLEQEQAISRIVAQYDEYKQKLADIPKAISYIRVFELSDQVKGIVEKIEQ